jgi:hypothetical protein
VDIDRGANYGNTLTWSARDKPKLPVREVEVLGDLDKEKFYREFIHLMTGPTPEAHPAGAPK